VGPYLPVILQACHEQEYADEYRAGTQSHGAFTYTLAHVLRTRPGVSFTDLVAAASARISDLGHHQHPTLLGPQSVIHAPVPWQG
jgi:hypothetical protein